MDYLNLNQQEIDTVKGLIEEGNAFYGAIPEKGFDFILENYLILAKYGVLEENWMLAYTHASNFENVSLSKIQKIFNSCNKKILQEKYPIYQGDHFNNGERFSLFRGCAGPIHKKGMSWTSSLDKAIWYAAKHSEYYYWIIPLSMLLLFKEMKFIVVVITMTLILSSVQKIGEELMYLSVSLG